jgi:integrase/recombinase XerD
MMKAVDSYLDIRRAAGFELKTVGFLLRSFARFASTRGETHVRTKTVIQWAYQASSIAHRDERIKTVRRFALHVQAESKQHEVPPQNFLGYRKKRRLPFIYTQTDITHLIQAALRLGPPGTLRPHTYATLFALLIATGLRISEALALRLEDVTRDGLIIRKAKFQKSRLIPLHETAKAGLDRYLLLRKREAAISNHIFVSRGRPLYREIVYHTFRKLLEQVDLEVEPPRKRPRIHDLRHTFAVRALETAPQQRDHVSRHMLALSTYLGHRNISDTYWYLEATPHLMQDISGACEAFWKGDRP